MQLRNLLRRRAVPTQGVLSSADLRFIQDVRGSAQRLQTLSTHELRSYMEDLRAKALVEPLKSGDRRETLAECFALAVEGIRRSLGWEIYDVQLLAARSLARSEVAEMQTGEGKTLACAPAAIFLALSGRGVHVATPNAYLAERDTALLRPVYEGLGFSVEHLPEQGKHDAKRRAYQADITYGSGYEFGFDFLKDQLGRRAGKVEGSPRLLGETILERLHRPPTNQPTRLQRPLSHCLIDEADYVLLDDAVSPLVISKSVAGEAPDAEVYRLADRVAMALTLGLDYHIDGLGSAIQLTPLGIGKVHEGTIPIPTRLLRFPWTDYVLNALRAHLSLQRNVHYVVRTNAVEIIDASSSRIFADRTWSDGLHQAVEAKEGLNITPIRDSLAQITRQKFYRLYANKGGMTGTTHGCLREFRDVYGLGVTRIPRRFPSRRVILPTRFFLRQEDKRLAIVASVKEFHARGQPVLLGTHSIAESLFLGELLRQTGIEPQILNGCQDATESEIISQAGQVGAVTIATNMAGRGTDIRLGPGAPDRGGLHVILSECHLLQRVDCQLIGRGARQNDPGSAQTFASAEDTLFAVFGGWIKNTAERYADRHGEVSIRLEKQIIRLQRAAERRQYAARQRLLRQDLRRESVLSENERADFLFSRHS